ncbi:hypothetical protein [Fibrella forsythiae]|uniref:Uncharacterized protein n=1 Tax=Fibrella forsythiae TaxID=2817061 RepID=A0ABS3JQI3_9BACT|nr:hypothetical protein [Fibrella forsythiae]MBO0952253.1 hypothetical protein [Fibrella forsythiae]
MPRTTASYVLICLVSVGLLGNPAPAQSAQQPVTESAKVSVQKSKTTATKPASVKVNTVSTKPATAATAKVADKPGKRFWSRIMSCFRDVHSVEKKTNK